MRARAITSLALAAAICGAVSLLAAAQARSPAAPAGAPEVAAPTAGGVVIDALTVDPGRFVLPCQAATLAVDAREAGAERPGLAFDWTVLAGPPGATLLPEGAAAAVSAPAAGRYQLRVTVTGAAGAAARTVEVTVLAGGTLCPPATAPSGGS